jgi:hypothetical protein
MIGQSGTAVDVEAVAVGMSVLALDLEGDTDADLADVRGGVVIAVDTHVDPDTGEIQRVFLCAKQWRREVRFSRLTAAEVRDVLPFNSRTVWGLVKAMARVVAEAKGTTPDTSVSRCIDAQARLLEVLA